MNDNDTRPERLPRTYLYVPGDRPARFGKAIASGADAVIFDLEDGVTQSKKGAAVENVAALLAQPQQVSCWVRLDNHRWADDLPKLVGRGLRGVVVPKAESGAQITVVASALEAAESAAGLQIGSIRITPLVESPAGVAALAELVVAPRVLRLGMGEADLRAALLLRQRADGLELLYVRSQVVLASAVAGIAPPIASTSTDFRDLDALARSTQLLRDLGFSARTAIHPAQLPVVLAALAPSPEELTQARAILAAYDGAQSYASGVSTVDGSLVDLAVVRAARALLASADE